MPHFPSPHLDMPGLPAIWQAGLGQGSGPGNGGLRNLGIEGLLRPEGWNIGIMEMMMHLLESKVEVADHTKRFSLDERQFGCVLGL